MLTIEVHLLCGRYTATIYNDRDAVEWPPHPARLFSAMVATWADNDDPDADEWEALTWLEEQGAPEIHCEGTPIRREVVTHFVPVNDTTALTHEVSRTYTALEEAETAASQARASGDGRAEARASRALEKAAARAVADSARAGTPSGSESMAMVLEAVRVLPENRGRQARTYPTVRVDDPVVRFSWPGDAGPERQRSLDGLLARVGRLGHSSTLVSCRVTDDPASRDVATWLPVPTGGTALRVPRRGLVNRLEKMFAVHQGTEPRTLPAGFTRYSTGAPEAGRPPQPILSGDWVVLGLPRLPSAIRLTRALDLTRAVRGAVMRHGPQPAPELLSGHRAGPATPSVPTDRPHMAVLALADVGHRHSDATVHAVALVLPRDAGAEDRAAIEEAVTRWQKDAGLELRVPSVAAGGWISLQLAEVRIEPAESTGQTEAPWLEEILLERRLVTTSRWYWCQPSRRWASVTPIALDRFPRGLTTATPSQRERGAAAAAATIARACTHIGLPDPIDVRVGLDPPLAGVPLVAGAGRRRSAGFPAYRSGSTGQPRLSVHVEVEFAEPVSGPVVLGAGRYLGYGLCLPMDRRESDGG